MATIGNFSRDGEGYAGSISTLALKAKAVIKAVQKSSDQAPDYRIFAAGAEIGAAWTVQSKEGKPYLNVRLDDPSFSGAVYCRLFGINENRQTLVWSRAKLNGAA